MINARIYPTLSPFAGCDKSYLLEYSKFDLNGDIYFSKTRWLKNLVYPTIYS